MDSAAPAADDETLSFYSGRIEKAGEVSQGDPELTTVRKLHPHAVGIKRYFPGGWFKS
jgi:hypothetical protein